MRIVWCDVETGGFNPEHHDVTQVGLIFEIDGHVAQELNLFLYPDPNRVTMQALDVQGRSLEQVLQHPLSASKAAEIMMAALKHYSLQDQPLPTFAGQFPSFDRGFVRRLLPEFDTLFGSEMLDLKDLAKQKLQLPNGKLATICAHLGISYRAHDALEDIRATRMAYRMLGGPA